MKRYLVTYSVHEPLQKAIGHTSGFVAAYPWLWLACARARHFNRECGMYATASVREAVER